MNKPYAIYINGVLALKKLTLVGAIKVALKYFPSYIVDQRNNSVVWRGVN